MRILITGGAGHIGTRFVEALRDDAELVVFDAQPPAEAQPDVDYQLAQLSDLPALEEAMDRADVVVHLAAIPVDLPGEAPKLMEVNFVGTFNVFEAAARAGVRRVVFASSICALGFMFWKRPWTPQYFPVDEKHEAKPDDMYGLSKAFGEMMARAYTQRYGLETVCLRLAPVWFDDMRPFTTLCAAGILRPEINRDALWSYVDVSDAVEALRLASLTSLNGHRVYNIGGADVCSEENSLALISRFYPDADVVHLRELSANPHMALWDVRAARAELGYDPAVNWRSYISRLSEEIREAAQTMELNELKEFVRGART